MSSNRSIPPPTSKQRKPGAEVVKLRLPPDLADAVQKFAGRVGSQVNMNWSSAVRVLLRLGLAADANAPLDLGDAGFREGWMRGHARAVEAHQRALHGAKQALAADAA